LPAEVGNAFQTTDGTTYKTSILLGMPMAQAHQCERLAPPFGLFVHESARPFSPPGTIPLRYVWWKWDHGKSQAIWNALKTKLAEHLDWCSKRPTLLLYDLERIKVHKALVDEYFV
jgi:hypothetical protein